MRETAGRTREPGARIRDARLANREMHHGTREIGVPTREIGVPTREIGVPTREIGVPTRETDDRNRGWRDGARELAARDRGPGVRSGRRGPGTPVRARSIREFLITSEGF
jgi:hypothetical protein